MAFFLSTKFGITLNIVLMKTLKLIGKLMAIILLTTAGFCDDEEAEYTCEDCMAAQTELCNALAASNCDDSSGVNRALDKVHSRCDNGVAKASALKNSCFFGELSSNCGGYSCN